jgi:benzylsuccinate CoA-transferase BbsE subunit
VNDIDLLAGRRVLDFGNEAGAYAGRVFVELGADVILVEPPGGLALRNAEPLVELPHGGTVSATFLAYAAGKRSVTIDESDPEGLVQRARLLETADVALLPMDRDEACRRGLDPDRLPELHPRLVVAAVTPFGLAGPRRAWLASDTTAWASSGLTAITGEADRPPVVAPLGLTNAVASLNAAMGALLAVRARRTLGHGQTVDVSMQEAVLSVSMEGGPQNALEGQAPVFAARARLPGVGLYEAADGGVDLTAFLPTQWDALAAWIAEELGVEEATLDSFRGPVTVRMPFADVVHGWIGDLTSRYTKQAFFLEAQRRGIPAGPINDTADLLDDPHLVETGAWEARPAPDLPGFRLPCGPLTADGARPVAGSVPRPGEHNAEILGRWATASP